MMPAWTQLCDGRIGPRLDRSSVGSRGCVAPRYARRLTATTRYIRTCWIS